MAVVLNILELAADLGLFVVVAVHNNQNRELKFIMRVQIF
jgi:hypothetical protein